MQLRTTYLLAALAAASSITADLPSARGEVGAATVQVRALYNRDTTTDIDITTNGTISHVETRVPARDGYTRSTNLRNLERPLHANVRLSGVVPHDTLHVRTHVHTDDPNHHDVVALDEIVKRRPDLFVAELVAPPRAVAGVPAIIRATVRELNGDIGARANCRLFADGVEVDRAEGIAVNAGGVVQCAFAPVFELGDAPRKQLAVVVDAVDPGDWDDSNNVSAVAYLRVEGSVAPLGSHSAGAREEAFAMRQVIRRPWSETVRETSSVAQSFRFDMWVRERIDLATLSLTASAASNGDTLFDSTTAVFTGPLDTPGGARCAFAFGLPEITVCDYPNAGATHVDVFHGAADAVHRSTGWTARFGTFEPVPPTVAMTTARFANVVQMDLALSDGVHRLRVRPVIGLRRSTSTWDMPADCRVSGLTDEAICTEVREERSILGGGLFAER